MLELFAGAGGMALGFERAGLESVALVEIDKDACATLRKNRPGWNVLHQDVSEVDFSKFDVDVVSGGFPCQAFSYAGKGLGFEDTRGTLFFEFARAIKESKPKIFIGENVEGLKSHDDGRTLRTMVRVLTDLGYDLQMKVLNATDYSVAQKRKRVFLIGTLPGYHFVYPTPHEKKIVLRDALKDVPPSKGTKFSQKRYDVLKLVPPGGCWVDLPLDIQKEFMGASFHSGGGKRGMARRISWDEACLTLTTSPSQKQTERCHPEETRPFTIREYARIQAFPDEWFFEGSITSSYKQIGNAVAVNVAEAVGQQIIESLENPIADGESISTPHTLKPEPKQTKLFETHKENKDMNWSELEEAISNIIENNADDLFAPNNHGLTPYERAAGFVESTRSGSKQFNNKFGKPTLEQIWNCSELFTRVTSDGEDGKGGCDGYNSSEYFESKSRHNTMKGSQAYDEIMPKLQHAINEGKKFSLLILVDKKMLRAELVEMCKKHGISHEGNVDTLYSKLTEIDDPHRSQDIPLHEGSGLTKIQNINGYDPNKHRWRSGLEAIKYIFPNHKPEKIRDLITSCITREYRKRKSVSSE